MEIENILQGLKDFTENNVPESNRLKNSDEFYELISFEIPENLILTDDQRAYYSSTLPGHIRAHVTIPGIGEFFHCERQYGGKNPKIKYSTATYRVLRHVKTFSRSAIGFAQYITVFVEPISGYPE